MRATNGRPYKKTKQLFYGTLPFVCKAIISVGVGASTTRFVQVDSFVCSFLPTMEETNQRKIANKGEDAARGRQFFPLFGFSPIFRGEDSGKGIGSRRASDSIVVRGCFSWFACSRDLGGIRLFLGPSRTPVPTRIQKNSNRKP